MAFCFIHIELFKWFFFVGAVSICVSSLQFVCMANGMLRRRSIGTRACTFPLHAGVNIEIFCFTCFICLFAGLSVCAVAMTTMVAAAAATSTKTRNSRRNMIFYLVKQKFMMFTLLISTAMAYGSTARSTAIISISFGRDDSIYSPPSSTYFFRIFIMTFINSKDWLHIYSLKSIYGHRHRSGRVSV